MKLGEIAAASTQTIKVPFVPEYIVITAADLTKVNSLKVNVFGEGVIVDLPNAGIAALDAQGQVSDDPLSYQIPIANGKWVNKDCEITIENTAVAGTISVFGYGSRIGTHFVQSKSESYLQYQTAHFDKFLFLAFPAMAAGDMATVVWNVYDEAGIRVSNFNEQMLREEVKALSTAFQGKSGYWFNNYNQLYKSVDIVLSADSVIYYSRIVESQKAQ